MMKHKYAFAALAALSFAASGYAATLTVTSLADDGSAGTLRALCASAAGGDEIVFADSLAGGTIALTTASGPITFAKSLSIVGPADAPITIDGLGGADGALAYNGGTRTTNLIYATDPDATLTLKNLVFTGSKCNQASTTPEVGPAVSVLGKAIIDNCRWFNNGMAQTGGYTEDTGDGGGCLRVAKDLSLFNSAFVSNGVSGCNYSLGGLVSIWGENVTISNCWFHGSFGWGGSMSGGNVRAGATMNIGSGVANFTMSDCLIEKATSGSGGGGVAINKNCSNGTFRFRNCAFRDLWGSTQNWSYGKGGAVVYPGSNANAFVFEVCEFSNVRINAWGGAVRVASSSARVVFANCTFFHCVGNTFGGVTDTRCTTYYVNCTAGGNVNAGSEANGSGTFFVIDRGHYLLNCVCAWNYNKNGTLLDDTSRYGSTLGVYNSYNHSAGAAANTTDNAMDYDSYTAFFAEPNETVSSWTVWTSKFEPDTAISSPVLTIDEKAEAKDPAARRVVGIKSRKDGGVLDGAGWPVKHSADWSSIAYTKDNGVTWTALVGQVADATITLAADSRGVAYAMRNGLPVPPIGSAAVPQVAGFMVVIR